MKEEMDHNQKVDSNKEHQEIKKFFENTQTNRVDGYDDYSEVYETLASKIEYQGYEQLAKELLVCFHGCNLSSKLILDVGSGTGLLGKSLAAKGFTQIDALDISQASLDEAKKKNVYKDFFCCVVTNKPTPNIAENSYDAVVSSGSFIPRHIKMDALEELTRVTKKDGLIAITVRDPDFEIDYMLGLHSVMASKKLQLISMKLIPYMQNYSDNYKQMYAYLVVLKVL